MQDLISHEYVFQTLLGPTRRFHDSNNNVMRGGTYLKWIKYGIGSVLHHVCARSHTICGALNKANIVEDDNQFDDAISMVYKNLTNNEQRDLEETDLSRVMKEEEIANVLQLFEGAAETKHITESSLRNWMVKVCNRREVVAHLLNSSSNVIEQLSKIFLVTLTFLVALVWCLMMKFGTTKYSVYISSLLVVLVWFSGKFCKIICDGIMLAIVMHPFDKGDHCIIDNEQLAVEEIGLINTVFLKDDNERVNYPNSVLLMKPITNLNRSSDVGDTLELLVSSPVTIAALELKIDELLGSQSEKWRADHCFYLKGIDDATHIYNFQITYATNFQNYREKNCQRSELVMKLRNLLEELNVNFTIR